MDHAIMQLYRFFSLNKTTPNLLTLFQIIKKSRRPRKQHSNDIYKGKKKPGVITNKY